MISIIDPSIKKPELSSFNFISSISKLPLTYHLPALYGFDSLKANPNSPSGIILMGSFSSPNENSSWQKQLATYMKKQIKKNIPILGICFGHQFIAKMFGADITYRTQNKKLFKETRELQILDKSVLLPIKTLPIICARHREVVSTCPKQFKVLATSKRVAYEIFQHKTKNIWTIQGHPEIQHGFSKTYYKQRIDPYIYGQELLQNFLNYCQKK